MEMISKDRKRKKKHTASAIKEESEMESIPKRRKKKQHVREEEIVEEAPEEATKEEEEKTIVESIPKRRKKKQRAKVEVTEEVPKEEESVIESIPKKKKKKQQQVREEIAEETPKETAEEEETVIESIPKRRKKKQRAKEEVIEEVPKEEKEEEEAIVESIPKKKKKKHQMEKEEIAEETPKEAETETEKEIETETEEKEEESVMESIPKRRKKKHQSKNTIDEDSFYDSSTNKGQKVNRIKEDSMDDSDDSEEISNNDFDSQSERIDDIHSDDFEEQEVTSRSAGYSSNSIWNRVKIVQTKSPVQFLVSLVSQRITLTPQFNTSSYYYIYCTPQQRTEKTPDLDYLIALTFHSNLQLYSNQYPKPIILDSIELARVVSVHCLVMSSYFEVYPPIKIDTPVDIVEEAPEIVISYKDRTTNSFLFSVNSTVPCYLWCSAFRQGTPPPSVIELMRKPKRFMRSFIELEETGLTPDVAYKLFCYAESVRGSPMNTPVENTFSLFTTKEGIIFIHLCTHL